MQKLGRASGIDLARWGRRLRVVRPELPKSVGPKSGKPRRRLRPEYSVKDFFRLAQAQGLEYVVLRWFDDLPDYDPNGDIDILIADEHLAHFERFFVKATEGGARFDVYTVGGLSGTRYRGLPYYPPEFARRILDSRVVRRGNIPVPNDTMHFYSLAYHAIYQKHERAGIPLEPGEAVATARVKHDYLGVLTELGKRIGVTFDGSVRGLHNALVDYGVAPSVDTLRKLAVPEQWLSTLFKDAWAIADELDGFQLFVVRETAFRAGRTDEVCDMLEQNGFEIVFKHVLSDDEVVAARSHIRGGNWGGITRFPGDAGGPAALIGTYDPEPIPVPRQATVKHPGLENYRLQKAKRFIRHSMNKDVPLDQWCSHVHSADGTSDAVSTLMHVAPAMLDEARRYVAQRIAGGGQRPRPAARRTLEQQSAAELNQRVADYAKLISEDMASRPETGALILGIGALGGPLAEKLAAANDVSVHLDDDHGMLDRLRSARLPKIWQGGRWIEIGADDLRADVGLLFNDVIQWDDWGGYLRWAVRHCAQVYLDLPSAHELYAVERLRREHALQFIEWHGGVKLGSVGSAERGVSELYSVAARRSANGSHHFAGRVMEGKGSSQVQDHYYIDPVEAATGVKVRPGTLNLSLQEEVFLRDGIAVPTGKGDYHLFPCKVEGMDAFIVKPPRARNGGWSFEIFSPLFLRRSLGLGNGDHVSVSVDERHLAGSVDEVPYNVRARSASQAQPSA